MVERLSLARFFDYDLLKRAREQPSLRSVKL
jgi:hypothetical protein